MGIGNWELGTGKQLFSGHPSKSLHCFIYPNAQCPITNDQLPKQPFLIELYTRVDYRKLYMRLHYFFPSLFFYLITSLIPNTRSTFSASIFSNSVLFQTYFEFWYLSTHSLIRSLPSSLRPFLSGYSGSV